MKANELRIGNLVTIENPKAWPEISGVSLMVSGFHELSDKDFLNSTGSISLIGQGWVNEFPSQFSQFDEFIQPIKLTEEWLLKFGFQYNGGDGYKSPHNTEHWYFTLRNGFMPNSIARGSIKTDNYTGCKYVHQLQNLYFALTGEELTVSPYRSKEPPTKVR